MNTGYKIRVLPTIQSWLPGTPSSIARQVKEQLPEADVSDIDYLDQSGSELSDADILITNQLSDEILNRTEELEWVQVLSAGVTKYPLDRLREKDVLLTSASGVHAEPIAEQVIGYILLFERRLIEAIEQQKKREWKRHVGNEIRGNTVGIVGLGTIGQRIAQVATALGLDVVGTKRTPIELESVSEVYKPSRIGAVLEQADYLVLACPLNDATQGLIRQDEYNAMNSDAILINVARAQIAPEQTLVDAIRQRRIRGAAIDVFDPEPLSPDSPLWSLRNVIVTPHSAGTTPEYFSRCVDIFAENYRHFAAHNPEKMNNRVF